ncbi:MULTISPECIES: DNA-3-methyladenine glycosylase I [Alphaproteobacteria]|uniref:3-methyladenine DNA glycosylase n=2 Tax=Alphaproteobacteria TaxID=28211 RepID=A0A512HI55_9HYPH|nr:MULTISPECIES: DNA-3-methyladenine glycosylase I [Alphaproteobacteria]GEO85131.1 3-methyladenine DNA glycosylase [Ciceribacter naphthalenivorans]GLR24535.1 3-methyladenine DNA glycosylase [Ciceribacter naphthalenivorans]GLT07391.1 3-methyladenine DNA glycosylase [Sphingomonas psychrolutea]
MRSFDEIWKIAADRKGGDGAVEAALQFPKARDEIAATPDDRLLSLMTKCIFQSGFNWKVVEAMWLGFEAVFDGFNIARCAMLHDEDFERLVSDTRIVRHGPKIRSVQQNAVFLSDLAREYGSPARFFADWPADDYFGLLDIIKKRGSRLGGNTGQYFLRFAGIDGFILSQGVVNRLIAEGVVDKTPSSAKDKAAAQTAFNGWRAQSGRSLTEISRVLAISID